MDGKQLKMWRLLKELSQMEAAEVLDIGVRSLARYESGEAVIPDAVAERCGVVPSGPLPPLEMVTLPEFVALGHKPATGSEVKGVAEAALAELADILSEPLRADAESKKASEASADDDVRIAHMTRNLTRFKSSYGEIPGCDVSWDDKPARPPWKRIPGCIQQCHESIPDPLPYAGPSWAGSNSCITRSGRVYNMDTGRQLQSPSAFTTTAKPWANPKTKKERA